MKDQPFHRLFRGLPVRLAAPALGCAVLGTLLGGCDGERLTGTSVGTGNPGVVTLGFVEDGAAVRLTGRIAIFAVDHNPLVDSLPLAAYTVEGGDSLELDQASLLPPLRRADSGSDSDFAVNVLVRTRDGRGAWYPRLGLVLRAGRLLPLHPRPRVELEVVPLDAYRGEVAGEELAEERRYLTVFGSPFFGKVAGGAVSLDSIPRGSYEARLVRFLADAPATGNARPAPVHALAEALDTRESAALSPLPSALDTLLLPPEGPREGP